MNVSWNSQPFTGWPFRISPVACETFRLRRSAENESDQLPICDDQAVTSPDSKPSLKRSARFAL